MLQKPSLNDPSRGARLGWGALPRPGARLPVSGGSDEADIRTLVQQMRAGDREAAAVFITRYGSRIRRRKRSSDDLAAFRALSSSAAATFALAAASASRS